MERVERLWVGMADIEAGTHAVPAPAGVDAARTAACDAMDDRALVEACRRGSREAFDVVVERHRRSVYQLCYRFVGNHEDASDAAQEVFLRAYRGLARFKGEASLATWLYRIGVNTCLNRIAARPPASMPLEEAHAVSLVADPARPLIEQERAAWVRGAIAQLPPKQRATLILRVYHELPHQEIARILGSSVGAAKANFFHALQNLKRLLGGQADTCGGQS